MKNKAKIKSRLTRAAARVIKPFAGQGSGAMIVAPANFGSLGDEAMIMAAAGALRERGYDRIALLVPTPPDTWPPIDGIDEFVFGPNSKPLKYLRALFAIASRAELCVIGADTLDGCYSIDNSSRLITAADFAARVGRDSTILGSSMREEPHPFAVSLISECPRSARVCLRDPISHARAERHTGRSCELTADCAFLMKPGITNEGTQRSLDWVASRKQAGDAVLGVNFNQLVIKLKGDRQPAIDRLFASYVDAIQKVIERGGVSVLCVPHDHRQDDANAQRLHDELAERVDPAKIALLEGHSRAPDAKSIAGACDAVVSGRMHFTIAALGSGTPVASVTYQGKFEGLYQHFQLDPLFLDPEQASDPHKLAEMMMHLVDHRDSLGEAVRARLPHVRTLSRKNFRLGPDALDTAQSTDG